MRPRTQKQPQVKKELCRALDDVEPLARALDDVDVEDVFERVAFFRGKIAGEIKSKI